ncbi:MAG: hypothetical protein GY795_15275 [Desulfobacterales bacterium]|nr:hypothetical protein [Desulfobacterales bacterium]
MMKCPVCENQIQDEKENLCSVCGWRFRFYIAISEQEEFLYNKELEIARTNRKELQALKLEASKGIVVDQGGKGDFTSINAALNELSPGAKIFIKQGIYRETVSLNKSGISLIGDSRGKVRIKSYQGVALHCSENGCIVRNIAISYVGGKNIPCIKIDGSDLVLENCSATSGGLACIAMQNKSNPVIRGNKIHDCKGIGIACYEYSRGIIENNDISGSIQDGIRIRMADPIVRNNRIHARNKSGIVCSEYSNGIIENNDISGNTSAGIIILNRANPIIKSNKINKGNTVGIFCTEAGRGIIEDNDISDNLKTGIIIENKADPVIRDNRINRNGNDGIKVRRKGQGIIIRNDLRDNKSKPLFIESGCLVTCLNNVEYQSAVSEHKYHLTAGRKHETSEGETGFHVTKVP